MIVLKICSSHFPVQSENVPLSQHTYTFRFIPTHKCMFLNMTPNIYYYYFFLGFIIIIRNYCNIVISNKKYWNCIFNNIMKVDVYLIWHTNLKGNIFVQWLPSSTHRETDPVSSKLYLYFQYCVKCQKWIISFT